MALNDSDLATARLEFGIPRLMHLNDSYKSLASFLCSNVFLFSQKRSNDIIT